MKKQYTILLSLFLIMNCMSSCTNSEDKPAEESQNEINLEENEAEEVENELASEEIELVNDNLPIVKTEGSEKVIRKMCPSFSV